VSFLIDPQGKIAEVWNKVNPATHTKQVLQAISSRQS
jgi:peroxiredoxin